MKSKYVPNFGESKPGAPNEDEWSEIYDACIALLGKLGALKWEDRDVGFVEYSNLIDALENRGKYSRRPL